jgi:putative nucleotidyltransferase with HDIG domain
MFTLLGCQGAGETIADMARIGLIEVIYEELAPTHQVPKNQFHHLCLFDHSVETVRQLELHLDDMPDWAKDSLARDLSFGISRLAALKLASLLHDIGKPRTWQINEDGRHTFYGHDELGAEMATAMAERMKWSRPVRGFISRMIKWHLRPGALFHRGEPTERALFRFFRKVDSDLPELILLALADLGATLGSGMEEEARSRLRARMKDLLPGYLAFIDATRSPSSRLLSGQDVMRLRQIGPGRLVGEILSALEEAQALKTVIDRGGAEAFVRDYRTKK